MIHIRNRNYGQMAVIFPKHNKNMNEISKDGNAVYYVRIIVRFFGSEENRLIICIIITTNYEYNVYVIL